jgi:thiamine biosynthesis lipoprotein
MIATAETSVSFPCFGSTCAVYVTGHGRRRSSEETAAAIKDQLLAWHGRFTRFESTSELSGLNADTRLTVPVSQVMRDFIRAAVAAAKQTGGLVDATLLAQLQDVGYDSDLGAALPLELALRLAPSRRPSRPHCDARWSEISVDDEGGTVTRPLGVLFDSGGLAKGLFADLLGEEIAEHASFAIDCAGDLRLGGQSGMPRAVEVASPFDGSVLHTFSLSRGGVATSGVGKRSWLDASLSPAHHLLDPGSGRPAYTGIVQATALAPSAVEAEIRAKAALLSGPQGAAAWLPDGGALVLDNGSCHVFAAADDRGGSTDA